MYGNLPESMRPKGELPRETRATCGECVMAKAAWPRDARDAGPFDAQLKCCTYSPFLPNFTVAKLIRGGKHENELAAAFEKGRLTPLGLLPSLVSTLSSDFGRDATSRCSFLGRDARCTIWSDRPSVCRAYFCVSVENETGQAKWASAEAKGNELEWTRAHELLWQMGLTQDEIEAKSFAEWTGRESEFFFQLFDVAQANS